MYISGVNRKMLKKAEKISTLANQTVETLKALNIVNKGCPFKIILEGVGTAEISISPGPEGLAADFAAELAKLLEKHHKNLITKTVHEVRTYRID